MFPFQIIFILFPLISTLDCPQLFDYSTNTITCKTSCPTKTIKHSNKCLLSNQYLIDSQVHICQNGFVSVDRSLCCKHNTYLININGTSTCGKCNGKIYQNGRYCCSSSTYIDYTSEQISCRKIGTGPCSQIKINQQFKVCCPSNKYFHIGFKRCVNPSNYNCQSLQKICCSSDQRLQYINDQFICVSLCNWGNKDRFYCRKRFCNQNSLILPANKYNTSQVDPPLLSFQNQCCYSYFENKSCANSVIECGKKFTNRGWSICCPNGQFYSISSEKCSSNCQGYILFERICIANGKILNLQNQNGQPNQTPSNSLCNGKKLPENVPVCCPRGFYIDGSEGCKLCYGRIFNINVQQVCCKYNEVFDFKTQKCSFCDGNIDQQGVLCCFDHQYLRYSSSGTASCAGDCPLNQIYKTQYCCESLSDSQCSITNYKKTLCNPSYFGSQSCQVCPRLCPISSSRGDYCTRSDISDCNKICSSSTVFFRDIGECLPCDQSCSQCIKPFDNNYCSSCQIGYVRNGQICQKCSYQCQTCSNKIDICTSCPLNSNTPVLNSGKCIPECGKSNYFDSLENKCRNCNSTCLQCVGSAQSQCSKCNQNFYLGTIGQGFCMQCSYSCSKCYRSNSKCVTCRNSLYTLNQDNWNCQKTCNISSTVIHTVTSQYAICRACHPKCQRCQQTIQNCVQCKGQYQYLSDTLGVSLCQPCVSPCQKCVSKQNCTTCLPGFYITSNACNNCDPSCKTCYNESDTSCLSCYGQSQLISGKCVGCSASCRRCDTDKNCLQCKVSFLLYKGNCVTICPDSTYPVQVQCYDCLSNCSSCTNKTICISCSSTHPYKLDDLCLKVCPSGYEDQNGICTKIIDPIDPIDPVVPVDPIQPVDPTDPIYPIDPNNKTDPNNSLVIPKIINQKFSLKKNENNKLLIRTQFQRKIDTKKHELNFILINTLTGQETKLKKKLKVSKSFAQIQDNQILYEVEIPEDIDLKDQIMKTQIGNQQTSFVTSNGTHQFLFYDYQTDPLAKLKYIGLVFAILILFYALLTKIKGHFLAQQSNTLILHMLNFCQVVYLFKFTHVHSQGMYHFLNGFSFMHVVMFPNFFIDTIPQNYSQYPVQQSLIPDSNFIKNAGGSISLVLILIFILLIMIGISYYLFKKNQNYEMPQIRKITRIGILFIHLTFLNILFVSFAHLIQPHVSQPENTNFVYFNLAFSIIFSILLPLSMLGIIYHFYKTYNSDVLQHYYTIREGFHYLLIFTQSMIFTFAIGKPLICLSLIILQLSWLLFNYMLYRYGQGYSIKQFLKFIICDGCIILAYIMLSVTESVNWIVIVILVSLIVVVLMVYSSYQIVGLYYYTLFPKEKPQDKIKFHEKTK